MRTYTHRADQQVVLKVMVVKTGQTKSMPFSMNMSAGEVCRDIRDKIGEGGSDHGLFVPATDYTTGKWLENNKTLNFYELRSGDVVEFKKKHRPLRVQLVDGSTKTVLIDDSMPASDLVAVIAARVGISNAEEFSLKKVDSADNEWLNPGQTLREQGLEDADPVMLKQRFHYSDANVDTSNPVQLNLLFEQSREGILMGKYPVTEAESIQFAALLCQVNLGDHNPAKHKPGSLDLKSYLPKEYVKSKKIDKTILGEHRKLLGMSALNAKFRFVQLCRSLKTYGTTFFLVREQVSQKKKKKLVDRLLGITREKIIRLDAQTKEVLNSYPLAHLRRWAASTNSFTFDFGDYEDSYYSVQTSEGEAMSQVISGYIDIILKKKKQAGRYVVDDDDEQTVVEEDISSMKAQAISKTPGAMQYSSAVNLSRAGMVQGGGQGYNSSSAGAQFGTAQNPQAQNAAGGWQGQFSRGGAGELESFTTGNAAVLNASGLGGLLKDLEGAFASVNAACNELSIPVTRSPMGEGDDPMARQWRQKAMQGTRQQLRQQTDGMTVATAQVVGSAVCATPDQFDPDTLAAACKAVGQHMSQMATLARTAASLVDDAESAQLIAASRELGNASKRLVAAANGAAGGLSQSIVDPKLREEVLTSAKDIGKYINQLLASSGASEVDGAGQTKMFERTAAVAQQATKLVNDAKNAANSLEGDDKARVNTGAKQVWTATSQLVACVKVLAPTVASAKSKAQLEKSAALVRSAVGGILDKAEASGVDSTDMGKLKVACQGVNQALQELLSAAKSVGERPDYTAQYAKAAAVISAASRKLVDANGNPQEIIQGAKAVGQGSAVMIKFGKAEAGHETDPGVQKALVDATRRLADATSALMRSAKAAASNPGDAAAQDQLANDARELDIQAQDMLANSQQRLAMRNLADATSEAVSKTAALIQAAKPAASNNRNGEAAESLIDAARQTAEKVTSLVNALKAHQASPENSTLQGKLVTAAKLACVPTSKLVNASKVAAPTVTDPTAQQNLAGSAKGCAMAMQKLLAALKEAKALQGGLEFDTAIEACNSSKEQMKSTAQRAAAGTLVAEFGMTPQSSYENYMAARRAVHGNLDQLLKSSQEKDQETAAIAAKDIGSAMRGVGAAIDGVAATSDDPALPAQITDSGQDFADKVITALAAAKACANDPENENKVEQLLQAVATAKASSDAMTAALPGQREVESAMTAVRTTCELDMASLPTLTEGQTQKTFQDSFLKAARALAQACQALTRSVDRGPDELAAAANGVETTTGRVVESTAGMAAATQDEEVKTQIVETVAELGDVIQDLLEASKEAAADPNNAAGRSAVNDAHLAVTDTLNELQSLFQAAGPGQKECDAAMKAIKKSAASIESAVVPSTMAGKSYAQIHAELKDAAKALARGTGTLMQAAKKNPNAIPTSVDMITSAVETVSSGAAAVTQAVGDGGKVTVERFTVPQEAIKDSVNDLRMANGEPKKIIAGCTGVAKSTQAIIAASKMASRQVEDPEASQAFMDLAKAIAGATAATVGAGKAVARSNTPENNAELLAQSDALQASVAQVVALAEDHLERSSISPEVQQLQKEILANAKDVAGNSSSLIGAAKLTAMSPQDVQCNQDMLSCAKNLSDAIADLLTSIANAAPGAQECAAAMDVAQNCISELDTASMSASVEALEPEEGQTTESCQTELSTASSELQTLASKLTMAAASSPHEIGPVAQSVGIVLPTLTNATVGLAAVTKDPVKQQNVLGLGKGVCEAVFGLLMTGKDVGGAADDMEGQMRLEQSAKNVHNAINALVGDVSGELMALQMVGQAQHAAKESTSVLGSNYDTTKDYKAFNEDIVAQARVVAGTVSKLSSTAKLNPDEVGNAAVAMSDSLTPMMVAVNGAAETAPDEATKTLLVETAHALASEASALLVRAGELSKDPQDFTKQQSVSATAREVNMQVAKLVGSTKQKSSAVKGCESAIESIQGAVHDLDTAAMFASMGQLEREDSGKFAAQRSVLMQESKSLAQGSAGLINNAKTSSASLAPAAEGAADRVNSIVEATKAAAASVYDSELQKALFDACREMLTKTAELVDSSRQVHDSPSDDGLVGALNESGQSFAAAVSGFVAKIKEVDAENGKGLTAAMAAVEAVNAEIPSVTDGSPPKIESSVEQMVESARRLAASSASIVSATRSTPELLAKSAEAAQEAAIALLQSGRAASEEGDETAKAAAQQSCVEAAQALVAVLQVVVDAGGNSSSAEVAGQLGDGARVVAEAVKEVSERAKELRADYFDPNNPADVAQRELQDAAAQIEAASLRLATLVPRTDDVAAIDLDFHESLILAAESIARAVASLVQAASEAQREIVASGKASTPEGEVYHADETWMGGLVSAAKSCSLAVAELANEANQVASGESADDGVGMIAASEQVGSTVSHLVHAAVVKLDGNSKNKQRLEDASTAVRSATQMLVGSATEYQTKKAEAEAAGSMFVVDENSSAVARMRREREARARVLALERELEAARLAQTDQYKSRYAGSSSSSGGAPPASGAPKPKPKPSAKPKPAAASPSASSASSASSAADGQTYSLEQLKQNPPPAGVDPSAREKHLSDADFEAALGVSKDAFYAQPGWKQESMKRRVGLF